MTRVSFFQACLARANSSQDSLSLTDKRKSTEKTSQVTSFHFRRKEKEAAAVKPAESKSSQSLKKKVSFQSASAGIKIWDNGERYVGFLSEKDLPDRFGIYWRGESEGFTYEGEFKGGTPDGFGVKVCSSGIKYEGEFSNQMRHGFGRYTREETDSGRTFIYEGEWKEDVPCGFGVSSYSDKSVEYKGEFVSGSFQGKGTITWADGEKYQGQFMDNFPHGKGIKTLPDGTKYEGEFAKGVPCGHGIQTWPDGEKYEGEFVNGLRDRFSN